MTCRASYGRPTLPHLVSAWFICRVIPACPSLLVVSSWGGWKEQSHLVCLLEIGTETETATGKETTRIAIGTGTGGGRRTAQRTGIAAAGGLATAAPAGNARMMAGVAPKTAIPVTGGPDPSQSLLSIKSDVHMLCWCDTVDTQAAGPGWSVRCLPVCFIQFFSFAHVKSV